MNSTSLQHKTVRPGSLVGYSYYHSNRRAAPAARPMPQLLNTSHRRSLLRWGLLAVAVLAVLILAPLLRGSSKPAGKSNSSNPPATNSSQAAPAAVPAGTAANHCTGQKGQLIIVSISQRHLWACQGSQMAYDTPVVTGIDYLAADKTPTGTYHITGKQTNLTLTGADSTGTWSDPVQYWMPFLHNQYGTYGFHDATWRANDAFGNISPNSADASHGCVELPLASAQWLYGWASVGTAVVIES